MDLNPYAGIACLLGAAALFAALMLALANWLGPKNKSSTKQLPFECGAVSVGEAGRQRFNVRFYLIAMLFILFDVEVIFLYPWAVALPSLGWPALIQMLVFVSLLGVGLFYVWRKGVLDWND